jgi:hypothetical protein
MAERKLGTGLAPKDRAICGMAVAITVPSRFSMKNAPATRSAMASGRRGGGNILIFRSANYDAWATNDFFPSDGRMGEWSLVLYECLSACKLKGRNSSASGTNVSLRPPISVNATVSISCLLSLLNSFRRYDPSFGPYR